MMKKFFISLLILTCLRLEAQVLNAYVSHGLEHNLQLLQQENSYKESLLMIKQAKAYFMPQLSIQARYSLADGGRIIEFPIGDLMNPVYENIANLYKLHGFPTGNPVVLENEEFPFFRPTEQETKVRLVQPVFNSDIYFNYKAQKELSSANYNSLQSYKRELAAMIKTAYFDYLEALAYQKIVQNSKILALENIKLNKSLYDAQKVTIDKIYRAEASLQQVNGKISEAKAWVQGSKAYFNFLTGREANDSINTEAILHYLSPLPSLDALQTEALKNREELAGIYNYSEAVRQKYQAQKWKKAPELSAVVDYGFQGEKYTFGKNDDFVMASFLLSWKLFSGMQEHNKTEEARLQLQNIDLKRSETEQLILLQVNRAYYDVLSAEDALKAAQKELTATQKSYQIVKKQYEQGLSPFIELLQEQNNLFAAERNTAILTYELWKKYAELEKVCATELIFE